MKALAQLEKILHFVCLWGWCLFFDSGSHYVTPPSLVLTVQTSLASNLAVICLPLPLPLALPLPPEYFHYKYAHQGQPSLGIFVCVVHLFMPFFDKVCSILKYKKMF